MYYNEAYEARKKEEDALMLKWQDALNMDGGIKDEHLARTTAICLENYLQYLHSDPRLIAEDRVESNAFTGVNLALLGLIARVVPNLIGAELVGLQAMPTPRSPIFTLRWYKDTAKGRTGAHEEMWVTPVDFTQSEVGLDPFYTSQIVNEKITTAQLAAGWTMVFANQKDNLRETWPYLFANTMYVTAYNAAGVAIADYKMVGDYTINIAAQTYLTSSAPLEQADGGGAITIAFDAATRKLTASEAIKATVGSGDVDDITIDHIIVRYEYKGEAEPNIPEMSLAITDATPKLIRRQLRGKYTMDAAYDLKKLHGINIDTELGNMMKVELQAEINREIVGDVRMLAGISEIFDYANFIGDTVGVATAHNYNDAHLVLLDAINIMCARIHVLGRLGRGNWVLGSPTTLAFLDRVPGFVGSGVNYNGKEIAYAGILAGRVKFYVDPLYPSNELLIGYKGPGALDAGYIHAPYLPITATPTMIHPETGDPSKLFYTRYSKTFMREGSVSTNYILNGQYQYARLQIAGMPAPLNI